MAKTMTNKEAVKLYISKDGAECLFCGETNLQGSQFDVEDGATRQEMYCPDCENGWVDSYHLAAVIHDGKVYDGIEQTNWDYHIHGTHQFFHMEDWISAVANKDTILGYQHWVEYNLESLLDRSILDGVDAIEVAGCSEADGIVEVTEDVDAEFYSVYTHRPQMGVECICDFNTKGQAVVFAKNLANLTGIPVYGNLCSLESEEVANG